MTRPNAYIDPDAYRARRDTVPTVSEADFVRIHTTVEQMVAEDLTMQASGVILPVLYTAPQEQTTDDLAGDIHSEDEVSITAFRNGRPIEARLLSPDNYLNQELGATAIVGIRYSRSLPLFKWLMQSDGSRHWMLEHQHGFSIEPSEVQRFLNDLTPNGKGSRPKLRRNYLGDAVPLLGRRATA